jgi:hypothetical protein
MPTLRPLARLTALLALLSLSACDTKDSATDPGPGTGTIILQLDHVVGADALELGTGNYVNAAGNAYTVSNLEYVVSDFVLEIEVAGSAPGDYEWTGVHYRSEADPATRTLTFEDVPAGDYGDLRFVHGIVAARNTTGAFPELDTLGMAWPAMQGGGYHYMRHEGAFTPTGGGTANFTTHTGPTAGLDYSVPVTLVLDTAAPARHGFQVAGGDTITVRLEMDVNQWYTVPNDYDFNDYAAIMGNSGAQGLLQANGATVWSVAEVTTR